MATAVTSVFACPKCWDIFFEKKGLDAHICDQAATAEPQLPVIQPVPAASGLPKPRSVPSRFASEDDIHLLREVVGVNPYQDRRRWHAIATSASLASQKTSFTIDARRARERTRHLLDAFIKEDNAAARSSGTEEEPFSEKKELLQEIRELFDEEEKKRKSRNEDEEGRKMRQAAMGTMPEGEHQGPSKKRAKMPETSATTIIIESLAAEKSLRERELALKEQEHLLSKERWELEKKERENQIKASAEDRSMMMKMFAKFLEK